jgi:hypothetical protein
LTRKSQAASVGALGLAMRVAVAPGQKGDGEGERDHGADEGGPDGVGHPSGGEEGRPVCTCEGGEIHGSRALGRTGAIRMGQCLINL